jgi:hypothetical protein
MSRDSCLQSSKREAAISIPAPICSPKEPCATEESGDDVVYLGTFPRRRDHATDKDSTSNITTTTDSAHKPRKNRPSWLHRKDPGRGTNPTKRGKGSGCTMVPESIRCQNIRIGHARDSNGQVYGLFDEAGRFRRQVEVDRSRRGADPGPFIALEPISHEQVLYSQPYQNMSSQRVRSKVRQLLMEESIRSMSQGEI